jgi:hypothetical protein
MCAVSDPIKAALDAATQRKRCTLAPLADERADTAAVVAEFLRERARYFGDMGLATARSILVSEAEFVERAMRAAPDA